MTMTSDDQRREVAQALRGLNVSDIEVDGLILDGPKYVGLLLMRILDEANDYRPGLHYFPSHFSARAVVDLFADLIDRPTCEAIEHGRPDESNVCKSCSRCSYGWFECIHDKPYSYCPNCGAVVVEKEEDDD